MQCVAGKLFRLIVTAATMVGAPDTAEAETVAFDHATLAQRVLERHIRPGYARLATATHNLGGALGRYCRQPSSETRGAVDKSFNSVVTAWGRIEHVTFGPVAKDQRLERVMFWPDRRGIGARQLATVLRARDVAVLDRDRLAEKSVAIQGLPALDTILFGAQATASDDVEEQRYRCSFASAIAANLANIAAMIEREWSEPQGYAESWLTPALGNPNFLKASETTLALAKALDRGLEKVRDERIAGPLGFNPQRRKISAVLATSGRTLHLIAAGIEGLRELYREGGMESAIIAAASSAPDSGRAQLAHLVSTELETAFTGASQLIGVRRPFDDPGQVQRLIALGYPLKNARSTASNLLSSAAGIPTGFNASDGD